MAQPMHNQDVHVLCASCYILRITHDPYPWTYLMTLTMCMDGWTENTQVIAVL